MRYISLGISALTVVLLYLVFFKFRLLKVWDICRALYFSIYLWLGLALSLLLSAHIEEMSSVPITANISAKPFIWFVWLGAILIVAGTTLAIKKKL